MLFASLCPNKAARSKSPVKRTTATESWEFKKQLLEERALSEAGRRVSTLLRLRSIISARTLVYPRMMNSDLVTFIFFSRDRDMTQTWSTARRAYPPIARKRRRDSAGQILKRH